VVVERVNDRQRLEHDVAQLACEDLHLRGVHPDATTHPLPGQRGKR
jgi:hypothetical protein